MKALMALWRFATDECPGGQKTTAICVKLSVAVLFAGIAFAVWLSPSAYGEYVAFRDSITVLSRTMEIQGIKDAAHETAQDKRLDGHERKISQIQGDLNGAERDIVSLKSDLRYLDATTVKSGPTRR